MRRGRRTWGSLVVVALAGCMGPIPVGSTRPGGASGRTTHSVPAGTPTAGADGASRAGAGEELRVREETLKLTQLGRELDGPLGEAAKRLSSAEFRREAERLVARWLHDKIAEMLLYQEAMERLGSDAHERIERHVDAELRTLISTEHQGIVGRYEKALAEEGRTLADVRERLRREVVISGFLDADVRGRVSEPTREELRAAYDAEAQGLRRTAQRRMSLIEVRVLSLLPPAEAEPTREQLAEARNQARNLIEKARADVVAGLSFAEAARTYSHGLHAPEGGEWGWVTPDSVRERFLPVIEALYRLDEGALSDIIETPESFFLVRCDEVDPGYEPDFQRLQPELREQHMRAEFNRLVSLRVTRLREKAHLDPQEVERFYVAAVQSALSRHHVAERTSQSH